MKCEKLGNHTISYQSLLLSTAVLNDSDFVFMFVVLKICFINHIKLFEWCTLDQQGLKKRSTF